MNIVAIYTQGVSPHPLFQKALHIITNTLKELDVTVDLVDLALWELPYYQGESVTPMESIIEKIQASQGVFLGTCMQHQNIEGRMIVFFDHCHHPKYADAFIDKPLLSLVLTQDQGEQEGDIYITKRWEQLKGQEGTQIVGAIPFMSSWDEQWTTFIERKTEDFYRILRQNRKSLPKSIYSNFNRTSSFSSTKPLSFQQTLNKVTDVSTEEDNILKTAHIPINKDKVLKTNDTPINEHKTVDPVTDYSFTEEQQKDIDEIAQLLKQQFQESDSTDQNVFIPTKTLSIKQMTFNLPHFFQPQLASKEKTIIQLDVESKNQEESFQASIHIEDGQCQVQEGIQEEAHMTLHVEEDTWRDILQEKVSLQKAFMVGKMKIKGNFILLNQFEQWFKKSF